jgi:hypothetical protein
MKVKIYSVLVLLLLLFAMQVISDCSSCSKTDGDEKDINEGLLSELKINIPLRGNAWLVNDVALNESMITDQRTGRNNHL